MSHLFRGNTPEDYPRDAVVYSIMLYLLVNEGQDSAKTDDLLWAFRAHLQLLEVEGVNVKVLHFYDHDEAFFGALSRATIARVLSTKTANDGRYHFEQDFRGFAEREMRSHLTLEVIMATNKVLETTVRVYEEARQWSDILRMVAEYKEERTKEATAAK